MEIWGCLVGLVPSHRAVVPTAGGVAPARRLGWRGGRDSPRTPAATAPTASAAERLVAKGFRRSPVVFRMLNLRR